jgi:indole-3-glycerol phosphate synthase/phosphoribosylanthranilate isomerase
VLDEILARKRVDVARRMERLSYDGLLEKAVPTVRRFGTALKKDRAAFILECKKASPSEGLIRADFDIEEIARAYSGVADAVSVLTDEPFFKGGFENLRRARRILDAPILCKDFVLGPYQVREARAHGADAVLLMLSVLDDETYVACAAEAERLSMDALTEVHSEDEQERAALLGARIIGVNNRNLKTLKVDLGVSSRFAARLPKDAVVVCESGIMSRNDVISMEGAFDAFLVGGFLMKSPRVDLSARRLVYGAVKICGLTSPGDAEKAYKSGATFGGLIFADESPRRVDESLAREIASASPMLLAGVFVNDDAARVARLACELNMSAVQLHGEETKSFAERLREALPRGCEVWKAVRASRMSEIPEASAFGADRILLDSSAGGSRGGTGTSFDWSIVEKRARRSDLIVAGGINPENAGRAARLGCFMIDVNSGVEFPGSPGRKDHNKIRELFNNLKLQGRMTLESN